MSLNNFTPVIPVGSLILVTGVNGLIGSHTANEALKLGYRVRGVVRAESKIASLKKRWDEQFPGQFEVTVVPDLMKEGAFDEAIKGVDAVAHIAAVSGDWTPSLSSAVATVKSITFRALEAAASTPTVKRFVLTSSVVAAAGNTSPVPVEVGQETWNEESKELAKEEGGLEGMMKALVVYQASKTVGEQAAWEWVREKKPSFDFYTVNPSFNIGEVLDPTVGGSTGGFLREFCEGKPSFVVDNAEGLNAVAVTDVALVHLGALLLPSSTLPPQRLFACAHSANGNDFLALFRRLEPGKTWPEDKDGRYEDRTVYDTEGALTVLRAFGKEGWKSLEEAVRENIA
ncbi:hypothetical protein JCM8547_002007 [Rhodosporidiobolus lusitaniae]